MLGLALVALVEPTRVFESDGADANENLVELFVGDA